MDGFTTFSTLFLLVFSIKISFGHILQISQILSPIFQLKFEALCKQVRCKVAVIVLALRERGGGWQTANCMRVPRQPELELTTTVEVLSDGGSGLDMTVRDTGRQVSEEESK